MLNAAFEGLSLIFTWSTFIYLLLGTLLGHVFGVLPGLTGSVAMALLIPITYALDPIQGIVLLSSAMGAVTFGGSITAILFNTPGTPNNAATCFDGYPLSRQGKAGMAIGASATASALGAIFGLMVTVALIPFMRTVVLAFAPPEYFLVAILGLTVISAVSGSSFIGGLIAGFLGLFLSTVGLHPIAIDKRFVFDTIYLWDGISLVPALIGIFAIAEMINLLVNVKTISSEGTIVKGGIWLGVKSVFENFWLFIRCSVIGVLIGAIPGIGGNVSNFVAYGHAVQTSKNGKFGDGDIRGVIASESANDSKDGGALMPTLALGIPGSPSTAVLISGLMIHGINPGKELFTEGLHIVFVIIGTLVVANLLTSCLGAILGSQLQKVTTMPTTLIAPIILLLTLIGSFSVRSNFGDVIIAFVFGLLGYMMLKYDVSRVPLIIGLVLGKLAEQNYHTSLQMSGGSFSIFFSRPISIVFICLILIFVISPFIKRNKKVPSSQ